MKGLPIDGSEQTSDTSDISLGVWGNRARGGDRRCLGNQTVPIAAWTEV